MSTILDKKWAAIDGDEIVYEEPTKASLLRTVRRHGDDPDDYKILALPTPHYSIVI